MMLVYVNLVPEKIIPRFSKLLKQSFEALTVIRTKFLITLY